MENLDIITGGEVLTNQLSNSSRDDATAASILESSIENSGRWVNIMDEDLVSEVNANDATSFIKNQTNDLTVVKTAAAGIQQQDSLRQEVNEI